MRSKVTRKRRGSKERPPPSKGPRLPRWHGAGFKALLAGSRYKAADIARILDVSTGTVSRWKTGKNGPGPEVVLWLALLFRRSPFAFYDIEGIEMEPGVEMGPGALIAAGGQSVFPEHIVEVISRLEDLPDEKRPNIFLAIDFSVPRRDKV